MIFYLGSDVAAEILESKKGGGMKYKTKVDKITVELIKIMGITTTKTTWYSEGTIVLVFHGEIYGGTIFDCFEIDRNVVIEHLDTGLL